ncbi:TIM-barrel domain-containing protein [Vallitalea guaymasensis]|uniref:glycoside hydrolase family 31 protein n=1 Tax=Vallitalea guaymasensis TaxID=1185412 RepID=UPI00235684CE|nr:TIM-barrel domain-containing protein [Vallitalea guaymasensis]
MIKRFIYGNPFNTEAVIKELPIENDTPKYGKLDLSEGFTYTYDMKNDIVFGLGENIRGINKRGYRYVSNCTDDAVHTEDKVSLYGAHNFIIILGEKTFGLFFDTPQKIAFDIGYTRQNELKVTMPEKDVNLYYIEGNSLNDIVKEFRQLIGRSYIPPYWAFGYQQSRWGYRNEEDVRKVLDEYRKNEIPLDAIYLDIDYMKDYKDFTVDTDKFPDFQKLVSDMKKEGIRLVPIIDAGVKIEDGYNVYEEGVAKNYFCKREDGTDFVAGVWPGRTHFPDFLNEDAREWFGEQYKFLLDKGIEGFWNDMNEPAIFYSDEGLREAFSKIEEYKEDKLDVNSYFEFQNLVKGLLNNPDDYKRFYHNVDGEMICHDKLHNLYGYNMTRAAGEAFERLVPEKRILMFSRSSYIGMHRYGGIWTGDNNSWWSHLLLNIKMMPSLNMCGFLYSGADIGGFGCNTTRDLVLRWLAFGIFTPLMRNHSCSIRPQECYQFEQTVDFKNIIDLRYRLIPYIYSEYMKAVLNDEMYFRPLAFDYPSDSFAIHVEDQLMVGEGMMVTPVYEQNAVGRYVYLPEDMLKVKVKGGKLTEEILQKGHHHIDISLDEVVFFIKKNHLVPICEPALNTEKLDTNNLTLIGYVDDNVSYKLYHDDGMSKDYDRKDNMINIQVENDTVISDCDNINFNLKIKREI